MANNRIAIRNALKEMLLGKTSCGNSVFSGREAPVWKSELPAILITTNLESAVPESQSARRYIRTLELVVEIRAESADNIDDDLDDLAAEVEALVNADKSLLGTVLTCLQTNTEMRFDDEAENKTGAALITFECKYLS